MYIISCTQLMKVKRNIKTNVVFCLPMNMCQPVPIGVTDRQMDSGEVIYISQPVYEGDINSSIDRMVQLFS